MVSQELQNAQQTVAQQSSQLSDYEKSLQQRSSVLSSAQSALQNFNPNPFVSQAQLLRSNPLTNLINTQKQRDANISTKSKAEQALNSDIQQQKVLENDFSTAKTQVASANKAVQDAIAQEQARAELIGDYQKARAKFTSSSPQAFPLENGRQREFYSDFLEEGDASARFTRYNARVQTPSGMVSTAFPEKYSVPSLNIKNINLPTSSQYSFDTRGSAPLPSTLMVSPLKSEASPQSSSFLDIANRKSVNPFTSNDYTPQPIQFKSQAFLPPTTKEIVSSRNPLALGGLFEKPVMDILNIPSRILNDPLFPGSKLSEGNFSGGSFGGGGSSFGSKVATSADILYRTSLSPDTPISQVKRVKDIPIDFFSKVSNTKNDIIEGISSGITQPLNGSKLSTLKSEFTINENAPGYFSGGTGLYNPKTSSFDLPKVPVKYEVQYFNPAHSKEVISTGLNLGSYAIPYIGEGYLLGDTANMYKETNRRAFAENRSFTTGEKSLIGLNLGLSLLPFVTRGVKYLGEVPKVEVLKKGEKSISGLTIPRPAETINYGINGEKTASYTPAESIITIRTPEVQGARYRSRLQKFVGAEPDIFTLVPERINTLKVASNLFDEGSMSLSSLNRKGSNLQNFYFGIGKKVPQTEVLSDMDRFLLKKLVGDKPIVISDELFSTMNRGQTVTKEIGRYSPSSKTFSTPQNPKVTLSEQIGFSKPFEEGTLFYNPKGGPVELGIPLPEGTQRSISSFKLSSYKQPRVTSNSVRLGRFNSIASGKRYGASMTILPTMEKGDTSLFLDIGKSIKEGKTTGNQLTQSQRNSLMESTLNAVAPAAKKAERLTGQALSRAIKKSQSSNLGLIGSLPLIKVPIVRVQSFPASTIPSVKQKSLQSKQQSQTSNELSFNTISDSSTKSIPLQKIGFESSQGQRFGQDYSQMNKSVNKSLYKTKTVEQSEVFVPKMSNVSLETFGQVSKQDFSFTFSPKEKTKGKTFTEPRLDTPDIPAPKPPRLETPRTIKPSVDFDFQKRKEKKSPFLSRKSPKGYIAEVKVRGRYTPATSFAVPSYEEAFAIGSSKVLSSPSATFKISESKNVPIKSTGQKYNPRAFGLFRAPKSGARNIFVQKQSSRIKSIGEIAGISALGAARRRKR